MSAPSSTDAPRTVAVFGSSEAVEGDALYETARRLGRLLAEHGFGLRTGGYGGVMEAASRGAMEAGGTAAGVLCRVFRDRPGNPYLTAATVTADLYERTRRLVDGAGAFVVLDGRSGTLAEVGFVWAMLRAGCLDGVPVILLGDGWTRTREHLIRVGILEGRALAATHVASSPEEVVARLEG